MEPARSTIKYFELCSKIDSYDFKGKRAIIRVDFNVPLDNKGQVTDDTRIRAAIPTIRKVLDAGGSVILMSHLGRPKKNNDMKYSLGQIVPAIEKLLGKPVIFAGDCMGEKAAETARNLKPGEVMLLENLRFYAEEEGKPRGLAEDASEEEKAAAKKAVKASQKEFVERLASYADCYINDAFGTAHRAHASTALIADKFPHDKMFGYVMENELQAVDRLMLNPRRPVRGDHRRVESFDQDLDPRKPDGEGRFDRHRRRYVLHLRSGAGRQSRQLALRAGDVPHGTRNREEAEERGVKLVFSPDALIADKFAEDADTRQAPVNDIPDGWMGLDIGEEGKKIFREHILGCKTILWNGPVGVFEMDKFATGSKAVAEAIAEATSKGAFSLIGGGDSVACINKFGLADKVSYVSTGGGALLEYIEGKELPGVAAIRK